jgi:DNA modification methylase
VILVGDCIESMRGLFDQSVHTCVTSPPYFGLRDYGHDGQIGLEPTPDEFVAKLVEVFRDVRRVLRDDGTLWLNLGDSYASGTKGSGGAGKSTLGPNRDLQNIGFQKMEPRRFDVGLADKQLIGIPWRVAFALQADGWYLRQDIIWHKPNPMPESVTDRCTKAHEYIFLLSKSARYYFDADAIKEPASGRETFFGSDRYSKGSGRNDAERYNATTCETRNKRSVWTVTTKPFKGAHFATFPPNLIEPCIKAGCPEGGTVLDPFGGSGTTGMVAQTWGRKFILCELNPEYAQMARDRIAAERDLFSEATACS